MEKKRLFRIMTKADPAVLAELASPIKNQYGVTVLKEPSKTLTMITMRDPVKSGLFYLGEVIVTEAVVEIDGVKGMAVTMGDDTVKALNMAVIDAACNCGVFRDMDVLLDLERAQKELEEKENALHLKTMVSFTSMDQEAAT